MISFAGEARAGGAWLPGGGQAPIEQRVAIAVGPARTTLWTSLRFDGSEGPVGLVVPASPRAAIDLSSDAWFEALNAATAPRVLPPRGVSPLCPGVSGEPDPFDVVGRLDHEVTLAPSEVTILADAGAVAAWAGAKGLSLSQEAAAQLAAMQGKRFVAARFEAPGGPGLTRTLRIATEGAEASLPLALTRAGGGELLVTAWLIGGGRAELTGTTPVSVPGSSLIWNAQTQEADYAEERLQALAQAGASGVVLECASHEALSSSVTSMGVTVDALVTAYFERAGAYGEAEGAPETCAAIAASALASSAAVSASCPRADHGVIEGGAECVESPAPGETDPGRLRCGPAADDLAVALSGLAPSGAWLTRVGLRVAAGEGGADWPLSFGPGAEVVPVMRAGSVSVEECSSPDGGAGGAGGASSGVGTSGSSSSGGLSSGTTSPGGGSSGNGDDVVVFQQESVGEVGCGCSGTSGTVDDGSGWDDTGDVESEETESTDSGCSGDTTESEEDTSDDGCSGDTTESEEDTSDDGCSGDTTESEEDTSDDGCSGDTTESEGDTSDDGCSGDTEGDTSDDGCSGDTEGDTSSDGCSGSSEGESEQCSITREAGERKPLARKKRAPKLSVMALGVLALLAPIRRASRPKRRGKR